MAPSAHIQTHIRYNSLVYLGLWCFERSAYVYLCAGLCGMYVCMCVHAQVRGLLLRVLPDGTVGAANATSGALNTNCSSLGGYALVNVSTAEALRIATSALDAYKQSLKLQQDEVGGSELAAIGTLCLDARASLLLQSEHSGQVKALSCYCSGKACCVNKAYLNAQSHMQPERVA
jgi:hypothetical protein